MRNTGAGILSALTLALLFLIIAIPALVLGGARTWIALPVEGLAAVLLLVQAARLAVLGGFSLRLDPANTSMSLFLLYAALRSLTTPVPYVARLEFFQIAACAVVFLSARYGLARSSHGIVLLFGLIATATAVALFSFWLRFHPAFHPYGETVQAHYLPRLTGTFGCPNHYAAFLYMATAAALAIGLFLPRHWLIRIGLFYLAVVFTFGIALSLSRGGWIGLALVLAATAVFFVRHSDVKWIWPAALWTALLCAALYAMTTLPGAMGRVAEIEGHVENHTLDRYIRIALAKDAAKIIRSHFWFGTGPATFVYVDPRVQDASFSTLATYTHDDYLNLWCDDGFVGFALGIGFVAAVGIGLWRRVDPRAPWRQHALHCAAAASWTGLAVHELLDFNLHIPACAFAFFALAGLGLRQSWREEPLQPARGRAAISAILAFALLAAVYGTARGYYPYHHVAQEVETLPFDPATRLLMEATKADPQSPDAWALLGDLNRAEAAQKKNAERIPLAAAAIEAYLRALEENPLEDGIGLRLGMTYDLIGREEEARLCYRRICTLQPHNGYFHYGYAVHLWQCGQRDEARAELEKAKACPYGGEEAAAALKKLAQ